jgi:hypothetical protein
MAGTLRAGDGERVIGNDTFVWLTGPAGSVPKFWKIPAVPGDRADLGMWVEPPEVDGRAVCTAPDQHFPVQK